MLVITYFMRNLLSMGVILLYLLVILELILFSFIILNFINGINKIL